MERTADPYLMNQDHVNVQPTADEYTIGGPSEFAEDVNTSSRWREEYADGQVARNSVGMPEFRKDTFNHPEKTAAMEATLAKKANLCIKVARLMLKGASESALEDQAVSLMHMPDNELKDTFIRLAADDEDEGEEKEEKAEDKEPEKEVVKKADLCVKIARLMVKGASESVVEDQATALMHMPESALQDTFKRLAGEQEEKKEEEPKEEEKKEEPAQEKQASQQQQLAQMVQAELQKQLAQCEACKMGQGQQQQQQVAQQQQQMQAQDQQQMVAQLVQQALQQMQQQGQGQQMQVQPAQQLDQFDIEMDAPEMGLEDPVMGPEDEILRTLYANDQQEGQEEQQEGQEEQQKQGTVRTAATRTVGTKPTAGVSKLGGVAQVKTASETDKLSSLWASAPDVSEVFGLNR